jgi:hypothetical protein
MPCGGSAARDAHGRQSRHQMEIDVDLAARSRSVGAKAVPTGTARSVLVEDVRQRGRMEQALGPAFKLSDVGPVEARAGIVVERAEAFGELYGEQGGFAFAHAFALAFLLAGEVAFPPADTAADAFDAGDVAHALGSFEGVDVSPQLIFEILGQAHHPVQHGE